MARAGLFRHGSGRRLPLEESSHGGKEKRPKCVAAADHPPNTAQGAQLIPARVSGKLILSTDTVNFKKKQEHKFFPAERLARQTPPVGSPSESGQTENASCRFRALRPLQFDDIHTEKARRKAQPSSVSSFSSSGTFTRYPSRYSFWQKFSTLLTISSSDFLEISR